MLRHHRLSRDDFTLDTLDKLSRQGIRLLTPQTLPAKMIESEHAGQKLYLVEHPGHRMRLRTHAEVVNLANTGRVRR